MENRLSGSAGLLAVLFMLTTGGLTARGAELPRNSFFPLDNGVGRGTWTPARQAQVVKDLGYDGIGYNYTTPADIDTWLAELHGRGLKLFSLYINAFPEKASGMKEAMARLKGSETVIWLTVHQPRIKGDCEQDVVNAVSEVADMAKEAGLNVVLYGHKGFCVATAEDGLRIANKVNRPNVGVTVNLCHELMAGNGNRLDEIIRKAAPRLMMVTINGADKDGKPDGYIQTLDRGTYDVAAFLNTLRAVEYRGPVGLQCYSIKGDIKDNLTRSMAAWKTLTARSEIKEKP